MDLGLKGKVIMVAASSRGLGYGTALGVARDGASVSLASRTASDISDAAERLRSETGCSAEGFVMDASDPASIEAWTEATLKRFGRIDGLVVNAGGPPAGKFDAFDDEAWTRAFNLTLMSAVRMIRCVLPAMKAQGSGSILTITSSSVKEPIDFLLLSNVYRAGVVALAKSLATDLAGSGIRVNNIIPGQIDTDRVRANDKFAASKAGIAVEDQRTKRQSAIPMGRYGTPEEFGKVAAFLLSDAAAYVTGATVLVDGGRSKTVW